MPAGGGGGGWRDRGKWAKKIREGMITKKRHMKRANREAVGGMKERTKRE